MEQQEEEHGASQEEEEYGKDREDGEDELALVELSRDQKEWLAVHSQSSIAIGPGVA